MSYELPAEALTVLSGIAIEEGLAYSVLDAIEQANVNGHQCYLTLSLPVVIKARESFLSDQIQLALKPTFSQVDVTFEWQTVPAPVGSKEGIANVKNIIAVASGKGGVGKSTTTANLALALQALGAKVGVVDADIYGPSQSLMLGVANKQAELLAEKQIKPVITPYEVVMMGMGNLVIGDAPMAWRGPMATGALQQLLRNTVWPELDYLLIDMPPGTGDIQLTLAQTVPVSGSVIVTTPQDIALLDARKGIELFRKVNIDVLGVIENMSTHTCSQCGHSEAIFGDEGGTSLAEQYDTALLGQLPLKMSIRQQADGGRPSVVSHPESIESEQYFAVAKKVALQLWQNNKKTKSPLMSESDD